MNQRMYDLEVATLESALKMHGWTKEPDWSNLGLTGMWMYPVEGSKKNRTRIVTISYQSGGGHFDIQEMDQNGPWEKYLIPLTDPVWTAILPFIAQFIANTTTATQEEP